MIQDAIARAPGSVAIDFPPVVARQGFVRRWLVPALSAVILVAALWQLRRLEVSSLLHAVPRSPLFWATFVLAYLVTPASEWLIYRRLWRLPASGFLALLRKRVSNEIVMGYSGEVYFYAWARAHAPLVGAPFGAIKDVSILSAAVANLCTLLLVAACWPLLGGLHLGADLWVVAGSAMIVGVPSLLALLFRNRIFTSHGSELAMISAVHFARIVVTTLLAACLWALVIPSAPLVWWLALAALRLLVSRLPLLPNKDVVFAGLVAFAVGQTTAVTAMLTMLAGLLLGTHLLLGAALGAWDMINRKPQA